MITLLIIIIPVPTKRKRVLKKQYARIDNTGRIVAGSNIWANTPPKNGTWVEVQAYECCNYVENPQ